MYEYITQFVRYSVEEDLMKQLNEAAGLGWEVLTLYPQSWLQSRNMLTPDQMAVDSVMVVYRRLQKPS